MLLAAVSAAIGDLLSREARSAFFRMLGVTLVILAAAWFVLKSLFNHLALPWVDAGIHRLPAWTGFLDPLASVLAGFVLAAGLAFLLAPTTALVAGIFLDEVAEAVERRDYPRDAPGRALPWAASLLLSAKFLLVVILVNAAALVLLLVPGVNLVAFLVANGYLLGREFFEFAAMRFRPEAEAKAMRRRHGGIVFLAGLVIAVWLAVPILNLTTPIFAAALMVHLHKALRQA